MSCFVLSDQESENADMPNGNMTEPTVDGEEMTVAVTRRTKKKRSVPALSKVMILSIRLKIPFQ